MCMNASRRLMKGETCGSRIGILALPTCDGIQEVCTQRQQWVFLLGYAVSKAIPELQCASHPAWPDFPSTHEPQSRPVVTSVANILHFMLSSTSCL